MIVRNVDSVSRGVSLAISSSDSITAAQIPTTAKFIADSGAEPLAILTHMSVQMASRTQDHAYIKKDGTVSSNLVSLVNEVRKLGKWKSGSIASVSDQEIARRITVNNLAMAEASGVATQRGLFNIVWEPGQKGDSTSAGLDSETRGVRDAANNLQSQGGIAKLDNVNKNVSYQNRSVSTNLFSFAEGLVKVGLSAMNSQLKIDTLAYQESSSSTAEPFEQNTTVTGNSTTVAQATPTETENPETTETSEPASTNDCGDNVALNSDGFIHPLAGKGSVTACFGQNECSKHGNRFHAGVDISTGVGVKGVPVVASASGKVIYSNNQCTSGLDQVDNNCGGGYGNRIEIEHTIKGVKYLSAYNHLFEGTVTVKAGDVVEQGKQIGIEGSSGSSSAQHIHFEIKKESEFIDPCKQFKC
jgi:murein DD-endopeptidase MepM/ murein hydrolase activator NlpD